jgi:hypothetical protein
VLYQSFRGTDHAELGGRQGCGRSAQEAAAIQVVSGTHYFTAALAAMAMLPMLYEAT